jgi:hypothetical protein
LVREVVAARPDLTLDELHHEIWRSGHPCRAFIGQSPGVRSDAQKKSLHAAEQQRPDVAAARENWRAAQPHLDPDRLVFIDETWATTNMTRRYGRAPPGQRLVAAVPHGHWKTSTFVAGLRTNGLTAPLIVDGAINGDIFRAYVEQVLAPTLRPGDIVILDDLSPETSSKNG